MTGLPGARDKYNMEINDHPLTDDQAKTSTGKLREKVDSLLKQKINNFLIVYFGYLSLALALIIFAVGLLLFIYPQYQQSIKSNETAKKRQQEEYKARADYLISIGALKNSYQFISTADRKKIETMVPVGNQAISLIPEIESIALKNGVVLNDIKIVEDLKGQPKRRVNLESGEKPSSAAGIFEKLPAGIGLTEIEVNLSSIDYSVLKNLLKALENNLWLLDISNINYDVLGKKVSFTIYSYYLIR